MNEILRFMSPLAFGKNYVHGRSDLKNSSRRRETAALLIDTKDDDGAGVLIAGDEKPPRRVDGKSARRLALRRGAAGGGQRALGRVDAENRDAVVTAVRRVEELPAGVGGELRPAV